MQKFIEKGKLKKMNQRERDYFKNKKRKEIRQIKILKINQVLMEFKHK